MRLVQFFLDTNALRVGLWQEDGIRDITLPDQGLTNTNAYLGRAVDQKKSLAHVVAEACQGENLPLLARESVRLTLPFFPDEVWGCGVTYKKSMEFRAEELSEPENIYERVYKAERPETFFKATTARCVGPGEAIGKRADSIFTAPEPELAAVVGPTGEVLGYTLANDVSAWDIERANALYLPQSKIYAKCCALGPFLVSADAVRDPYTITMSCRIIRQGKVLFTGEATTANLKRTIPELIAAVQRSNVLPTVTVILTGTGIIVPEDAALAVGDVVEITANGLGTLINTVEEV
ncbi:MAG: fumarylacetoacetate hydrolase family protein [bacterium]